MSHTNLYLHFCVDPIKSRMTSEEETRMENGETLLHLAVRARREHVCEWLLGPEGSHVRSHQTRSRTESVSEYVLQPCDKGRTALEMCMDQDGELSLRIAMLLLSHYPATTSATYYLYDLLAKVLPVTRKGAPEMIEFLFGRASSLEIFQDQGLHDACVDTLLHSSLLHTTAANVRSTTSTLRDVIFRLSAKYEPFRRACERRRRVFAEGIRGDWRWVWSLFFQLGWLDPTLENMHKAVQAYDVGAFDELVQYSSVFKTCAFRRPEFCVIRGRSGVDVAQKLCRAVLNIEDHGIARAVWQNLLCSHEFHKCDFHSVSLNLLGAALAPRTFDSERFLKLQTDFLIEASDLIELRFLVELFQRCSNPQYARRWLEVIRKRRPVRGFEDLYHPLMSPAALECLFFWKWSFADVHMRERRVHAYHPSLRWTLQQEQAREQANVRLVRAMIGQAHALGGDRLRNVYKWSLPTRASECIACFVWGCVGWS
jgi:hypothetical protein